MSRRLPDIRIEAVELVRVEMPLIRPFRTSFGRMTLRDALLVRVASLDAEGWGECVTSAAPVYSEEFTDGSVLVLRDHLVPRLLAGGRDLGAQDVGPRLARVQGHRMAKAALEAAVLDAQLRGAGRSLADHLGAVVDRVPAGVSVGIPDGGVAELVEQIAGYLDEGYVRVKAKVTPGFDVAAMRAVRDAFGPQLPLQVDANAGFHPDDDDHVRALEGLDELELTMIEQPFAPDRLRDHADLAARLDTPVCLDESILDATRARDALDVGACTIVNIKPGRVGGLLESVRIHDLCATRSVAVWCGGMLETGIGRAANVALAALPGFRYPGDTSASNRYFEHDVTDPFVLEDGHLAVPDTPGIGRVPHSDVLAGARWRERIDA